MPTLVFLHGFMGAGEDWTLIRERLPEYATSAIELQHAHDWQAGVEQLLSEIPERAMLVGYSMGARLALACVEQAPTRFAGLVFVSGSPGIEDSALRRARWEHDRQVAENMMRGPRREFLQMWYQQSVFAGLTNTQREHEIQTKLSRDGSHWPALLRTYSIGHQPDLWPHLATIAIPVLAMAGQNDTRYVQNMERFARLCASCQLCIVPDAGHIVHHEQPESFVRLLRAFADDVFR